jgi:hypothetical protein
MNFSMTLTYAGFILDAEGTENSDLYYPTVLVSFLVGRILSLWIAN